MDPVTLATITSAVTVLASECAKGAAGEAGKDIWGKIKALFTWKDDPPLSSLSEKIAKEIQGDPSVAAQIVELLKSDAGSGNAGTLVSNITAKKVVVAQSIHVQRDFQM